MYDQYIILFSILFTGYILRKIKFIDAAMNNGLNKFIIYFAYPCMIVIKMGFLEMSQKLALDFLLMFGLSLLVFALHSVWMYYYCKLRNIRKAEAPVVEISSIVPNNGFMGFPFALLFFGEEGLFLMLAHNAAMNFYFFSYGIQTLGRNKNKKQENSLKATVKATQKLLTNPNIIALMMGFTLSLTHTAIPGPLDQYLTLIGNVATPMAMIFIGSTLAASNPLALLRERIVIEGTVNKLFFVPLLAYVIVLPLPIEPILKGILVLACCLPTAVVVPMVAQQAREKHQLASKILFLSTIVSILTIPLSVKGINFFLV